MKRRDSQSAQKFTVQQYLKDLCDRITQLGLTTGGAPVKVTAPCQTSHPECIANGFRTRFADFMQPMCTCMLQLMQLYDRSRSSQL